MKIIPFQDNSIRPLLYDSNLAQVLISHPATNKGKGSWENIEEMLLWCDINVGIGTEDWDWGKVVEVSKGINLMEQMIAFVFKDKNKAMIFKLTWG
jgi:hypothetical protein